MNIELDEVVAQDISFETLELAAGVTQWSASWNTPHPNYWC